MHCFRALKILVEGHDERLLLLYNGGLTKLSEVWKTELDLSVLAFTQSLAAMIKVQPELYACCS
jgi:hypothetical protein